MAHRHLAPAPLHRRYFDICFNPRKIFVKWIYFCQVWTRRTSPLCSTFTSGSSCSPPYSYWPSGHKPPPLYLLTSPSPHPPTYFHPSFFPSSSSSSPCSLSSPVSHLRLDFKQPGEKILANVRQIVRNSEVRHHHHHRHHHHYHGHHHLRPHLF